MYSLKIIPADKDTSFLTRDFSYRESFADTASRRSELKNLLEKLYRKGYLEATYTSMQHDSLSLAATLFAGNQWTWAHLSNGNVEDIILDRIGFREKLYDSKPIDMVKLDQLIDGLLTYCENNGYPFASVRLDSIQIVQEQLHAKVFLTKNKLITIDSIVVKGNVKIAPRYLSNYLGVRTPSVYREDVVKKISTRLQELPFLTEERSSQLVFNNDRASIILFLKKKNASKFDFVLGILPNSTSSGKLLVTGDGQLSLNNAFGKGESLDLRFSQLQPRTTQVFLKGSYPYLFSIPFGLDGEFSLYRNDTLYLDVKEQIGLQYLFTGANYLKVFFRNESNSILSVDTQQVIQSRQLPPYLDVNTKFYGVEYRYEQLDYRFNPRKGISLFFNGQAGNRKIKENATIIGLTDPSEPSFEFSSLYDSLDEKETQYRLYGTLDKYWGLTQRSTIKTSYHGGGIISSKIFLNELYRLGGFRLLRGFDEESILASEYHVITAEYHYLLGQNSFFYLFFDGGYVENVSAVPVLRDTPFGFGAGANFETRAGIFGLSYALGSQQGNPIEFRSAKIHFGYLNYF